MGTTSRTRWDEKSWKNIMKEFIYEEEECSRIDPDDQQKTTTRAADDPRMHQEEKGCHQEKIYSRYFGHP